MIDSRNYVSIYIRFNHILVKTAFHGEIFISSKHLKSSMRINKFPVQFTNIFALNISFIHPHS